MFSQMRLNRQSALWQELIQEKHKKLDDAATGNTFTYYRQAYLFNVLLLFYVGVFPLYTSLILLVDAGKLWGFR